MSRWRSRGAVDVALVSYFSSTMMDLLFEIGPLWILLAMLVGALGAHLLGRRFPVVRRPLAFAGVVLAITVLASGGRWKYRQWKGRDYYNLESIDVPRGYTLKHGAGEDSYVGEIRFPDGRRIRMDIGFLAGIYANPEEPEKFRVDHRAELARRENLHRLAPASARLPEREKAALRVLSDAEGGGELHGRCRDRAGDRGGAEHRADLRAEMMKTSRLDLMS